MPRTVQFSTNHPEHLPSPDPELIALNAMICKVAYTSGAARHIDSVEAYNSYGQTQT